MPNELYPFPSGQEQAIKTIPPSFGLSYLLILPCCVFINTFPHRLSYSLRSFSIMFFSFVFHLPSQESSSQSRDRPKGTSIAPRFFALGLGGYHGSQCENPWCDASPFWS